LPRTWPLRTYFAALALAFVAVAAAGLIEVHVQARGDARSAALTQAAGSAATASRQLGKEIAVLRSTVAGLAGNPQIATALEHPAGCTLTFARDTPSDRSHLDIIRDDGTVMCSSNPLPKTRPTYGAAAWLAGAKNGGAFLAPVRDSVTGAPALIDAVPIKGGVVAGFVDLVSLGPRLAALYGGAQPVAFLVASKDGKTVIARSAAPAQSVGRSLSETSFARSPDAAERRDLDGVVRLYRSAIVPGVGWRFFAGERKSVALSAATRLERRESAIVLGGLLAMLLGLLVTYRRVAIPMRELGVAVHRRETHPNDGPVTVPGPTEVVTLGHAIDELISSVDRSEASYRHLFQQHPSPMWVADPDTMRFLAVNDALVRTYGFSEDEFLGMTVDEIRPSERREELRKRFDDPARPSYERGVWQHAKKDGTPIDVEVTSSSIEFDGRPARLILARDVSERSRLEAQLQQSQKVEAIGQLAGGIAHDFNNMLTAILGHAERAAGAVDPVARAASIDGITAAGSSAAALTRQLLAFSRRQVMQPKVVDIRRSLLSLESMLHRVLGDDVTLEATIEPDLSRIVVDPSQIEQVLLNLAINARDAMPGGGTVSIAASNVEVDDAYATARPGLVPGPYVELSVTDTGTGMDEETRTHIFEPFFTTKTDGTGLGLATTFGIVKQSDGYISVYSEPGRGTTFRLLFPAVDALPDGAVERDGVVAAPLEGTERVLIVEDEPLVRGLVTEILVSYGYSVLAAGTPAEARELASSSDVPIQLIVSDVMLPGQSGPELMRELLSLQPAARCLFTSGYAYGQGLGPGDLAGAEFLSKPFTGTELAAKVREALN
jgi:two-component system cell cycle sensor histidine kinase/response regulator CckA